MDNIIIIFTIQVIVIHSHNKQISMQSTQLCSSCRPCKSEHVYCLYITSPKGRMAARPTKSPVFRDSTNRDSEPYSLSQSLQRQPEEVRLTPWNHGTTWEQLWSYDEMWKLIKRSNSIQMSYILCQNLSNIQSGSVSGSASCPPAFSVCTIPDASLRQGSLTVGIPECIVGTAHTHTTHTSHISALHQAPSDSPELGTSSRCKNPLPQKSCHFSNLQNWLFLANGKTNGSCLCRNRVPHKYNELFWFPYCWTCHFGVSWHPLFLEKTVIRKWKTPNTSMESSLNSSCSQETLDK